MSNTPKTTNELDLSLAIIERDTAQYRKERLDKLVLELQSKTILITEKPTENQTQPTVKEVTFSSLIYIPQQSSKLGYYEIAKKPQKETERWIFAYNILKQNKATIQNRYQEEGYQYSYWLYEEGKIYRQKLKEK